MNPQRIGSLNKSARLIVIQQMSEAGTLDANKTRLARTLGVTRPTIYRDLADLKKLQPVLKDLLRKASHADNL